MSWTLHIPSLEELSYREKLLSQPETMAYNRGYDLPFEGYDRTTGCVAFHGKNGRNGTAGGSAQNRALYAYLRCEEDGVFVGDVNFIADRVRKSRTWAW